jgi:hypothetical protein
VRGTGINDARSSRCGAAGVFDGERYDLVARVEQILHLGAAVLEA